MVNFSQKNITDKHKVLLFTAGIVTVIIVFYYYVLIPQQERINQLTATQQTERQRVQMIEAFANAHPNIGQYEQELATKQALVNKMLPNNTEISEFILEVEKAAKTSNIQFIKIKPAQMINKNGYREIPLELLVKGNYFQTLDFLRKLEELPRFNAGINMTVQSQLGNLESKITVIIYSYGTAPTGAPEQPKSTNATNSKQG